MSSMEALLPKWLTYRTHNMNRLVTLLLVIPILLSSCSSAQEGENSTTATIKKEVKTKKSFGIDFENAVFVDVRTPAEFESGSFRNAINIPLNELNGRLDELNKSDQIVLFCRSGRRASSAFSILESAGFEHVVNGINTANLNKLEQE